MVELRMSNLSVYTRLKYLLVMINTFDKENSVVSKEFGYFFSSLKTDICSIQNGHTPCCFQVVGGASDIDQGNLFSELYTLLVTGVVEFSVGCVFRAEFSPQIAVVKNSARYVVFDQVFFELARNGRFSPGRETDHNDVEFSIVHISRSD